MIQLRYLALLPLLFLISPSVAKADQADLMLLPTRVVMENADRYSTVLIKNVGKATGDFSVDLVDMDMKEDGMVVPVEDGKQGEFSAIPYVRISPHSMTLKPGEYQNVRLLLRLPENLPDGEYRSHLRVKIDNDNVEQTEAAAQNPQKDMKVTVKAKLVLIIPVIFRHGKTVLNMQIDHPQIAKDASGNPVLNMYLVRDGNRSSMGDITVNYNNGGSDQLLKFFPGVPVYRPLQKRLISVPLDLPQGVNLNQGALNITYNAQEKEGGVELAHATMALH